MNRDFLEIDELDPAGLTRVLDGAATGRDDPSSIRPVLAGLGVGLWSQAELARVRAVDRVFKPAMATDQRAALYDGWKAAVARVRSGT